MLMIDFLSGNVVKKMGSLVVLNVQGVGYGVELILPTLLDVKESQHLDLWIHTRVREDSIRLFGFSALKEKHTFEILVSISGIGPKVAMGILSTLSVEDLQTAIRDRRVDLLEAVPGIGKRTAEKVLVELQGKSEKISSTLFESDSLATRSRTGIKESSLNLPEEQHSYLELKSALTNLGYKDKDVERVIHHFKTNKNQGILSLPELIRMALKELHFSAAKGSESLDVRDVF